MNRIRRNSDIPVNAVESSEISRNFHYLYAVEFENKRILRPDSMALVLGRSKLADFVISSTKVSRKHCEIICSGRRWLLRNLSPTGTGLVGSTLVQDETVQLQSEDILKIDGIFLQCKFSIESEDPPRRVLRFIGLIGEKQCSLAAESENQPDVTIGRSVPSCLDKSVIELNPGESKLEEMLKKKDDVIESLTSENTHTRLELMSYRSDLRKALTAKGEAELKEAQMKEQLKSIQENASRGSVFLETMETELLCSVCNEVLVDAVTLDCSHTFCAYCLTQWKKKNRNCPLCRSFIHFECKSRVIDSVVEKMFEQLPEETKTRRKELIDSRKAPKRRKGESNPGRPKRNRLTIQLAGNGSSDGSEVVRISFNYSDLANQTIDISSDDELL